jgi:hypothetical protein
MKLKTLYKSVFQSSMPYMLLYSTDFADTRTLYPVLDIGSSSRVVDQPLTYTAGHHMSCRSSAQSVNVTRHVLLAKRTSQVSVHRC